MSPRINAGSQQDVDHVQPRNDQLAGELAAEDEEFSPGADQRDRPDQTVNEPQSSS